VSVEHNDHDLLVDNVVRDLLWLLEYENLPASEEVLRDRLKEFDGRNLYQLYCEVRISIVKIGALHRKLTCVTTAT
jgi:hypothetical protein